jgi:hypothetical protein
MKGEGMEEGKEEQEGWKDQWQCFCQGKERERER